jgi:hypothetical protein
MKGKFGFAIKLAGAALAALIAADLLMPVIIKAIMPPQRLRALIVSEARKSLKREVRLEGVSYSLLKGLTLEDLAVSEAPNFKAGTFASVHLFHLKVRWLPLLRGRFVIDSVAAEGLKVVVVAERGGTYNFSGISASSASASAVPAAPSGEGSSPLEIGIRHTTIKDGEFIYRDEVSGDQWQLRQIDASIGRFRMRGPFQAELSLKGLGRTGAKPFEVGLTYDGTVDLGGQDPRRTALDIKKLAVEYGPWRVQVSGKANDFSAPALDLTFAVAAQAVPLVDGTFAGTLTAPASGGSYGLRGELRAKTGGFPGAVMAAYGLPAKLSVPGLTLSGKFDYHGDQVNLRSIHIGGTLGEADVSGVIGKLGAKVIEPNLEVKAKLDIPSFTSDKIPAKSVPAGLSFPPTKWEVDASVGLDQLKVRRLHVSSGHTDIEIAAGTASGLRSKQPSLKLPINARSFDLAELSQFSDGARQLALTGNGSCSLALSGNWAKPVVAGQLKFSGLGGNIEGLKLAGFAGTASIDDKRIALPFVTGKLGDGSIKMSVTVDQYATAPAIDLEADLDQFDLGKYLAAKAAIVSKLAPAAASSPAQAAKQPGAAANETPISAKGRLSVGRLIHPNANAKDVRVTWDLEGITADLRRLTGSAVFTVGSGGSFSNLGSASKESKILKVLLFPFMIFQKIGSIADIHLFPDFSNISFSELSGDYLFTNGLMTIRESHLNSDAGKISALGSINLPEELLDLAVTAHIAHVAPLEIDVKGTFDKPVTHIDLGKLLISPATSILDLLKR